MINFTDQFMSLRPEIVATRRDLHKHPELSFKEVRTAGIVAQALSDLGLEVLTGIGQTGVVGILAGVNEGPTVLVRCDMDALPIQEENAVEYCSTVPYQMHACGHDGHTAIALAVAKVLSEHRSSINGTVKFVFQPAEELGLGAQAMITDGVLDDPVPDVLVGLHLWNELPHGQVAVVDGPVMAGCDDFSVEIIGRGGHAALPDQTNDPIMAMVQMISSLQTIVSRNVPPTETAVVSVTKIEAGETSNIIPDRLRFRGTIRTFESGIRDMVISRFRTIIEQTAALMNCKAIIEIALLSPPVANDTAVANRLRNGFKEILPDLDYLRFYRTLASEDVAFFLQQIPGTYLLVGSGNTEQGLDYPHHHPKFDFDEDALVTGATLLSAAISEYVMMD